MFIFVVDGELRWWFVGVNFITLRSPNLNYISIIFFQITAASGGGGEFDIICIFEINRRLLVIEKI